MKSKNVGIRVVNKAKNSFCVQSVRTLDLIGFNCFKINITVKVQIT